MCLSHNNITTKLVQKPQRGDLIKSQDCKLIYGKITTSLTYRKSLNDSIRPMMILPNNQGDCLCVGFGKQSHSAAARIALKKQAL